MNESGSPTPEKEVGFKDYGVEYAGAMAPHVIDSCVRLGLDTNFVDFFDQYLSSIHMVVVPKGDRDIAGALGDLREGAAPSRLITPRLTMQSVTNSDNGKDEVDPNDPPRVHAILMSLEDIGKRRVELKEVFEQLKIPIPNGKGEALLQQAAIDWIFYEQACIALGNACFMEQNYPQYVSDFDGQDPFYNADRSLSAAYLQRKEIVDRTDLASATIAEDSLNLRKGFGLMMLHSALLAKGLVDRHTKADWIITKLRKRYPDAHRSEDISNRLSAIKPRHDVMAQVAKFALANFDPSLEPEFEAEEAEQAERSEQ